MIEDGYGSMNVTVASSVGGERYLEIVLQGVRNPVPRARLQKCQ